MDAEHLRQEYCHCPSIKPVKTISILKLIPIDFPAVKIALYLCWKINASIPLSLTNEVQKEG